MSEIAIIGAGAWGTALSIVLGRNPGHRIRLWVHDRKVFDSISSQRTNEAFLAGCPLPDSVALTTELRSALQSADIVVGAMPSHHCRAVFGEMRAHLTAEMLIVSATKGIETGTKMRMSEVIRDVIASAGGFTPRIGALSGPSFALEAARGDPTAVAIASEDRELSGIVQREFSGPTFRVYTNDDVVGVELGGALKNVIAMAAGVCAGLGLQNNSTAALITRGLAEMTRLVVACGGRAETMSGLAGLGDLVLTCMGGLSRNRSVGVELGRGRKVEEILAGMQGRVAEGVLTTTAAVALAQTYKVEMPITGQMHAILHDGKSPGVAIQELMTRSAKSETSRLAV
jgi:glycerol-3-phosphate dehydrogenase (NAD(P)+)